MKHKPHIKYSIRIRWYNQIENKLCTYLQRWSQSINGRVDSKCEEAIEMKHFYNSRKSIKFISSAVCVYFFTIHQPYNSTRGYDMNSTASILLTGNRKGRTMKLWVPTKQKYCIPFIVFDFFFCLYFIKIYYWISHWYLIN